MHTTVLVLGEGGLDEANRVANLTNAPFPILADPKRLMYEKFSLHKIFSQWQRSASVVIDKSGIIRYINKAADPRKSMEIDKLLSFLQKIDSHEDKQI